MALRAIKHKFTGDTTPITAYDCNKTNLGSLMVQNTGSNPEDKFVGPKPVTVTWPSQQFSVMNTGSASVALTSLYATGTVSTLLGNVVTGSGTTWNVAYAGKLIGFGSNNPTLINAWYTIATRASNTSLTLANGTVGNIVSATSYVIADQVVTGSGGASFNAGMVGMSIGFGSSTPTSITQWYRIMTYVSATSITVSGIPGTISAGPYCIVANMMYPHAISISSTLDYVFLVENNTNVISNRYISLYEYNKDTVVYTWKGYISATLNTSAVNTIRGFRAVRYLHKTGTASTSGTAVTGYSSAFVSERIAVGARIGFGSNDPSLISTWYEISAIDSDTGLTISTSAGSITQGAYVIEELRFAIVTTNATLADGGLFLVKGVNYNDFKSDGTVISASTGNVDNLKLVYWLSDAGTTAGTNVVTNQNACGCTIQPEVSKLIHYAYVLDAPLSASAYVRVIRYNLRATGTVTSGKILISISSGDIMSTAPTIIAGTMSGINNGRIGTLRHGPGKDVESLYFVTTTRIYRAAMSNIYAGNLNWISENRPEIPPGGINTYPVTNALNSVEIVDSCDRLVILTSGLTAFRNYITHYPQSAGEQFDSVLGIDDKQQDLPTADAGLSTHFNTGSQTCSLWSENGIAHIIQHGYTANLCQMYALPLSAHWSYASVTNQRIISPVIYTPDCVNFRRVIVTSRNRFGSGEFSCAPESYRVYFRTKNITSNYGEWTSVDESGDLSGLNGYNRIQFMFEFSTIGWYCVPARILGFTVVYDDAVTVTDSHFQPSMSLSDGINKRFAWRFATIFSGTVPSLRVRLYDAITNDLLVDDSTVNASGTWEKTLDGTTWESYGTLADKYNEFTYIRYTPASLGDNIKVRAVLTQ